MKIIFKLLTLLVMCGGTLILLSENKVNADNDCFDQYDSCYVVCDDPNQTPPSQRNECEHTCFFNYALCKNQEFFDQEGEVIGELEDTQQIPDFSAFRRCMNSCPICPLVMPEEPVTEDDVSCVDAKVACKIACLAQL